MSSYRRPVLQSTLSIASVMASAPSPNSASASASTSSTSPLTTTTTNAAAAPSADDLSLEQEVIVQDQIPMPRIVLEPSTADVSPSPDSASSTRPFLNLRAPPPAITLPPNLPASGSTNQVAGASGGVGAGGQGQGVADSKPGGTARGGTKTPRKVQWATVVHDDGKKGPSASESASGGQQQSTHALDEQGLDPIAFRTLSHALERHRSTSSSPLDLTTLSTTHANTHFNAGPGPNSYFAANKPNNPNRGNANNANFNANSTNQGFNFNANASHFPPSFPSFPPGGGDSDAPSYFTRATTGGGGGAGGGGGEGGFPFPDMSNSNPSTSNPLASTSKSYANSQSTTADPTPSHSPPLSPSAGEMQGTHDVPGENYIDPDERAGLPGAGTEMDVDERAENVVKMHKRGLFGRGGIFGKPERRNGGEKGEKDEKGRTKKRTKKKVRRRRADSDVEADSDSTGMGMGGLGGFGMGMGRRGGGGGGQGSSMGTGVLSALLTLYDHPQAGESSASGFTSGVSTPGDEFGPSAVSSSRRQARSISNGREGREAREKEGKEGREGREGRESSTSRPSSGFFERTFTHQSTHSVASSTKSLSNPPSPTSNSTSQPHHHKHRTPAKAAKRVVNTVGLKGFKDDRPSQSRNAGGVFGALVASTGNISGVAAPTASTLAPNVKRPGYHLSRYSLDATPPAAKTVTKSRSTHFDTQTGHGGNASDGDAVGTGGTTASNVTPGDDSPSTATGHGSGGTNWPAHPSHLGPATPNGSTLTATNTTNGGNGLNEKGGGGGGLHHREKSDTLSVTTPGGTSHFGSKYKWTEVLKDLPTAWTPKMGPHGRGMMTPSTPGTPSADESFDEKEEMVRKREREKRRKRKKAEIYITRHVAEIIQRQEFILKLARALMMFGAPTHRLQSQMQSTARVLDIELSCMYLPDIMLISFDDSVTSTSNIKFIRQGSALDLGKLQDAYKLYWKVIHDDISVKDASRELDGLMRKKPQYRGWMVLFIGGMASASICSVSFNGSFIDSLVAFPLGALLVGIQLLSVRNELYSNVFEITIATLLSFIAAALAQTHLFCYSAVASASVVLILPGFLVLCGSLEISSRNIISGAVRLCFAIMYSLFLAFGLAIGAEIYQQVTKKTIVGSEDYTCSISHPEGAPWYRKTPSLWWAFLTVPMYSFFLSLRNQAPWNKKEMLFLVLFSCCGWVVNHFTSTKFENQSDISAAVGAFTVGLISNLYGRFFRGNAFVVMITGILFQLPSGLGNGGLLTFASQTTAGESSSYLSGFQTALQLISVSIGLTVGLGISLVCVHPIQSRRRQGGVFSL